MSTNLNLDSYGSTNDPGRKYRDKDPNLGSINSGRFGNTEWVHRGDHGSLITHEGLPRYWWRQLAVNLDKVVWMEYEKVIHVTTRKAWEQTMKFRRDFLALKNQDDLHQKLGYDILLGPFERPQRRYRERMPRSYPPGISGYQPARIILAPVVDSNTWKKHPTKIPKPASGTTRQYDNWRVRSDRNLWDQLRAERWLRRKYDADEGLPLKVTALEFLGWSIPAKDPLFEEFGGPRPAQWFIDEMVAGRPRTVFQPLLKNIPGTLPPLRHCRKRKMRFSSPYLMSSPELDSQAEPGRSPSPAQETFDATLDDFWLD
ncbi:hypothetical protein KCU85_g4419, partial [Aureobasidium melanogenum]